MSFKILWVQKSGRILLDGWFLQLLSTWTLWYSLASLSLSMLSSYWASSPCTSRLMFSEELN